LIGRHEVPGKRSCCKEACGAVVERYSRAGKASLVLWLDLSLSVRLCLWTANFPSISVCFSPFV